MDRRSQTLTIFEGPDGSGKSTAAKAFAEATGARYVHFPALPRLTHGLGRMYVEAMLPALLGYAPVVFDRCWLSEQPYGAAFRNGLDRLGAASRRMLERLAMRCGAVVVRCQPAWDVVEANFLARNKPEMLTDVSQLRQVYDIYPSQYTDLPTIFYDYTASVSWNSTMDLVNKCRYPQHLLRVSSAGNLRAPTVLVGAKFTEREDYDPWYQWPFASFSSSSDHQWLTTQLANHAHTHLAREDELLWVNADQDLRFLNQLKISKIIALGDEVSSRLSTCNLDVGTIDFVPHPKAWRQFNNAGRYPLLDKLDKLGELS